MADNKNDSIEKIISDTMDKSKSGEKLYDLNDPDGKLAEQKDENPSGKNQKPRKKTNKLRIFLIILLIILVLTGIAVAVGVGVIYHYIDKVNIVDETSKYEILDSIEPDDDITSEPDSPQEEIDKIDEQIKQNIENTDKKDNKNSSKTEVKTNDNETNYQVEYTETYNYDFDDPNVYNVLLIGTDARDKNSRGRSDSMILVSINRSTEKVIMTSFLRDIYLYIPNVSNTRLNHAYAYGGPDLLIETLESNFKVPIHNYVQVNFYSFIKVVDTVGGVDISVTDEEVKYLNQYLTGINNLEGNNANSYKLSGGGDYTLNGAQALAYSRIRYVGTDFGRTERQRTVLEQIISKMNDLSITELGDLLDEILPNVTTNIQRDEIFDLILDAPTLLGYERVQCRVPADNTWWNLTISGMAVLGIDFNTNIRYLGENIYNQY
ncbi:MAG: LCP family protein [Ruminococcus sp.]|nr:LCP family protein [Ruminococcus sp.]